MPLSLQCPHCNGAASVADNAAGKRVKCPHCEQVFLAPGVSKTANDDDDWLKLDSDPKPKAKATAPVQKPASNKPANTNPTKKPPGKKTPNLNPEEEKLLAEFATDLDEFTAEVETPPAPIQNTAAPPSGAPLPAFDGGPMFTGNQANPQPSEPVGPVEPEYATEYRVKCKTCGTLLYAKATQAGRTIKCSDCHSPVTVPSPPRIRQSHSPTLQEAPSFTFEERNIGAPPPDPYKKSATQLLDEAANEEKEQPKTTYDDTPSVKEWLKNIFGIFQDLGVLAHWMGLTLLGSIPVIFALMFENEMLTLALFPAGFFLGVLVVSCGFAILQAVANEENTVSEWPTLDPMGWLGQLFVAIAAACVSAVPAWMICHFTIGPQLLAVAITMFAVYASFPFVLLSMLDMNSVMVPFSPEVARSVTKCEDAWGGFYFSSGLLFIGLFLIFTLASTMNPAAGATIAIAMGVGVAFCYFSMLGRLAYAIGQAVNAPPMKNDIDRTRPTDTF